MADKEEGAEKKITKQSVDKLIAKICPRYNLSKDPDKVKPTAAWEHLLLYDSTSDQLEPIYFWLLDFMRETQGWKEIVKLEDNFAASPGGGYFSEVGAKATKMQEEGMKIMGTINTLIRTIINLIYDLKDFEIRLAQYEQAGNAKDKRMAESGLLALKNIWLDKVDMPQRGRGSIHQMTYELGYTTLRDAFMIATDLAAVDKMDLNDRVKRVLKPRIAEFFVWKERSEKELRKRFEIERAYLKSEVSALKLYTRWAKPYLKNAEELTMRAGSARSPDLVNAFNTMLLEVTLMGRKKVNIDTASNERFNPLPQAFKSYKERRSYYSILVVSFGFRGIPYRTPQGHYIFGGRVEVHFRSYGLNSDEIKVLDQELEKSDLGLALNLVEDTTESSLKELQEDLDHFIKGDEEKIPKTEESPLSFFGFGGKKSDKKADKAPKKPKKSLGIGTIPKDNFEESILRRYAEMKAAKPTFKLYHIFKKSKGMATFDEPEFDVPTDDVTKTVYEPVWR